MAIAPQLKRVMTGSSTARQPGQSPLTTYYNIPIRDGVTKTGGIISGSGGSGSSGGGGYSPAPTYSAPSTVQASNTIKQIVEQGNVLARAAQQLRQVEIDKPQTISQQITGQNVSKGSFLTSALGFGKKAKQYETLVGFVGQKQEALVSESAALASDIESFNQKYGGKQLTQGEYDQAQKELSQIETRQQAVVEKEKEVNRLVKSAEFERSSLEREQASLQRQQTIINRLDSTLAPIIQSKTIEQVIKTKNQGLPASATVITKSDLLENIAKEQYKSTPTRTLSTADLEKKIPLDMKLIPSDSSKIVLPEIVEKDLVQAPKIFGLPGKDDTIVNPAALETKIMRGQPLTESERQVAKDLSSKETRQAFGQAVLLRSAEFALIALPVTKVIGAGTKMLAATRTGQLVLNPIKTVLGKSKLLPLAGRGIQKITNPLIGTKTVQKIEVVLPSKIRSEVASFKKLGFDEKSLAVIRKGFIKGETKVIGTGKLVKGKTLTTRTDFFKVKDKTFFKLEDIVEKDIPTVFVKQLKGKAIGQITPTVYVPSSDKIIRGVKKISYGSDLALEKVRSAMGTSIFQVKSKQSIIGSKTIQVKTAKTRMQVAANKAQVQSKALVTQATEKFSEPKIITDESKFFLRLEAASLKKSPPSFVTAKLIETKTDFGPRITGKLGQVSFDVKPILKGKGVQVVRVRAGAKVGIIPEQAKSVVDKKIGVSFKGVGKKSSVDYFKSLQPTVGGKTGREIKPLVEKVLSKDERLRLVDDMLAKLPDAKTQVTTRSLINPSQRSATSLVDTVAQKEAELKASGVQAQQVFAASTEQAVKNASKTFGQIAEQKSRQAVISTLQKPLISVSPISAVSTFAVPSQVQIGNFNVSDSTKVNLDVVRVLMGKQASLNTVTPITRVSVGEPVKLREDLVVQTIPVITTSEVLKTRGVLNTVNVNLNKITTVAPTMTKLGNVVKTVSSTKTGLASLQRLKQITQTVTPITSTRIMTKPLKIPFPPPIFIPPMPKTGYNVSLRRIRQVTKAFEVVARVRGKDKILKVGVPKNVAIRIGARFVAATPSASFKIKEVGVTTRKDVAPINLKKFRKPKRLGAVAQKGFQFVEKTKYRIESPGEILGIPLEAARRRGARRGKK